MSPVQEDLTLHAGPGDGIVHAVQASQEGALPQPEGPIRAVTF
jgi:hypothetical protein